MAPSEPSRRPPRTRSRRRCWTRCSGSAKRSAGGWMEPSSAPPAAERHAALARAVQANVASAMEIAPAILEQVVIALLAEGHVLIEDHPGVAKTTLARALALSLDCRFARIQGTSDLMPAYVVGVNVYDQREQRFVFRP